MLASTVRKELQLQLRDRSALVRLFLMPVIFIAVFGTLFSGSGDVDRFEVAVWHVPGDARAEAITQALEATGSFAIERTRTEAAARAAASERDGIALILPADLDPANGRPAELVLDPATSPQVRAPLEAMIRGVVARVTLGPSPADQHTVLSTLAPAGDDPPEITGFQVAASGNSVMFGFFIAITVGLSFLEERRTGTWRRVLAAPVDARILLLAKLVPFVVIGAIQFAFLLGVAVLAFGLHIAGSLVALVALVLAVVLCATCLGFLMASLSATEKQLGALGSITILVMALLGGAMVPRFLMPPLMQQIGLAVPHAWALDGFAAVMVRPGTTLLDVAPQVGAVLGFAAVFAGLGAALFRFER
jgi:hypothetical protein